MQVAGVNGFAGLDRAGSEPDGITQRDVRLATADGLYRKALPTQGSARNRQNFARILQRGILFDKFRRDHGHVVFLRPDDDGNFL
jgi:hypothetical protein